VSVDAMAVLDSATKPVRTGQRQAARIAGAAADCADTKRLLPAGL